MQKAAGWAVILGFGFAFSALTSLIVWIDYTFGGTEMTSEEFNTAGRSVKTGLTASVIVSQWTWAATLLQSSNVAWKFGVSGPFWYASGATIQVLLFAILALHVKLKAPKAHTRAPPAPAAGSMLCRDRRWFGSVAKNGFLGACALPSTPCAAVQCSRSSRRAGARRRTSSSCSSPSPPTSS